MRERDTHSDRYRPTTHEYGDLEEQWQRQMSTAHLFPLMALTPTARAEFMTDMASRFMADIPRNMMP